MQQAVIQCLAYSAPTALLFRKVTAETWRLCAQQYVPTLQNLTTQYQTLHFRRSLRK